MALVDIENPTVIHDQRLLGLFQFWRAKLNGRRLPAGGEFDRADLARWADNLMMIDVPGDIADFRIRWLGDQPRRDVRYVPGRQRHRGHDLGG